MRDLRLFNQEENQGNLLHVYKHLIVFIYGSGGVYKIPDGIYGEVKVMETLLRGAQ